MSSVSVILEYGPCLGLGGVGGVDPCVMEDTKKGLRVKDIGDTLIGDTPTGLESVPCLACWRYGTREAMEMLVLCCGP